MYNLQKFLGSPSTLYLSFSPMYIVDGLPRFKTEHRPQLCFGDQGAMSKSGLVTHPPQKQVQSTVTGYPTRPQQIGIKKCIN
jgi:hypothetical protein